MTKRKAVPTASRPSNPERGEHTLTLAGKKYLLRPSWAAVQAIEQETGKSLITLSRLGNVGDLSIRQAGIVAAHFIRAGAVDELDRQVDGERVAQLIYEEGLPGVLVRLTLVLVDAATGGRKASGEAKAAVPDARQDPGTAA